MKSITLTGTSVVLNFASAEDRDTAYDAYRSTTPREVHSRARSGGGADDNTLTIRLQDIVHPVTIPLDGGEPVAPANMSATTGMPTHLSRFTGKDPENVPGANADARVNERATTSGVSLMGNTPGAVNNDPSTASNAGYEGSPAQAIASATGGRGPTPGGFQGPDKAAVVTGAAPGTSLPSAGAEKLHPAGSDKQDAGAVNVQRAADAEAKKAAAEAGNAPARPARGPDRAAAPAPTVTPAKAPAERVDETKAAPNSGKVESAASAEGVDR